MSYKTHCKFLISNKMCQKLQERQIKEKTMNILKKNNIVPSTIGRGLG
jgi:hypothetical protein